MVSFVLHALTLRCDMIRPMRQNASMDIHLNGQPRRIEPATTLIALLQAEGLAGRRVAIEVNGEIVPRGEHEAREVCEGDRVEIVHALGGG
jgi:sulfur carrier protein